MDVRWLAAGGSSHFAALGPDGVRLRFDFVPRPPRLTAQALARLWQHVQAGAPAVAPIRELITLKQTMRLKDYAFIGGLSLRLEDAFEQMCTTLDAQHLYALLQRHPEHQVRLFAQRPWIST